MKTLSVLLEKEEYPNKYKKMQSVSGKRKQYDKISHASLMENVKNSIQSNILPNGDYSTDDNILSVYFTDADYTELCFKWSKFEKEPTEEELEKDPTKETEVFFSISVEEHTDTLSQTYINCSDVEGVQYCNPDDEQFFKLQYSYSSFEKAMEYVLSNRFNDNND